MGRLRYDVETGEYRYQVVEDIANMKQRAKYARDKEEALGISKHAGYVHLCGLSEGVCLAIKQKYGIDPANIRKGEHKRLLGIIQSEYPQLLYTNQKVG
jgi:hypothetical protein